MNGQIILRYIPTDIELVGSVGRDYTTWTLF